LEGGASLGAGNFQISQGGLKNKTFFRQTHESDIAAWAAAQPAGNRERKMTESPEHCNEDTIHA
jgi:hypothetical protein